MAGDHSGAGQWVESLGDKGVGGLREVGEERAESVRGWREIRNVNFFNSTMHQNTFKNKNPKCI